MQKQEYQVPKLLPLGSLPLPGDPLSPEEMQQKILLLTAITQALSKRIKQLEQAVLEKS
jgi:hypothetical protein